MNSINIVGRLSSKPELRYTQSNKPVSNFTVAVNRPFKKDIADFFPCVAWDQKAKYISDYGDKGMRIAVSGILTTRKWEDKDGNKRVSYEIQADSVELQEYKESASESRGRVKELPEWEERGEDEDGDLPF